MEGKLGIDRRLFVLSALAFAACSTPTSTMGGGHVTDPRAASTGTAVGALDLAQTGVTRAAGVAIAVADVWPGAAPGGEKVTAVETVIERSKDPTIKDRAVVHVTHPKLKVFKPAKPDGSAVLVIPGGGYQRAVLDKEGDETALRLAQNGVTAAVLIYRMPGDDWAAGYDAPLQDAQRALRLLRSGRLSAGLDGRRIGVLGFSAGGNLAASLALRSGAKTYAPVDDADAVSARPDFAALLYAAYLDGGLPVLEGKTLTAPNMAGLVTKDTQPMFLVQAQDDTTVPVIGTIRMAEALKAAGVPAETHIFAVGGHGFGIANAKDLPAKQWPELFLAWGRERKLFGAVR